MKLQIRRTCLLISAMVILFSTVSYAKKRKIDLPNMTSAELEALKEEINEELSANHKTNSSQQSAVETVTKAFVENEYGEDNVSWAWFDYTYTKDWDFYTLETHADITKHDGGKAEYPVYSEVIASSSDYQVVYVKIGEEEIYNERSSKIQDKRILKMLGLEGSSSGEPSEEASAPENPPATEDTLLAQRGDKGDVVLQMQQMLARLGYLASTPDGTFGERTENALNQFKNDYGFTADGQLTQSVFEQLKAAAAAAPEPEEIISISAVDLYNQFDNNAVAAEAAYKGKTVQVTGVIDSIDKDIWGSPYVSLRADEYGWSSITCYFSGEHLDSLASLSSGKTVIIRGTCDDKGIMSVSVKDCTIVG